MRRAALIAPLALLLLGADPQGDPYEGMILIPPVPS
jgi:hypothetical protein